MFRALLNALGLSSAALPPGIRDWPEIPADAQPPALDLEKRAIGPLRFGAPLEDARALGRPDFYERNPADTHRLLYGRFGCELEFDHRDGLEYASFLIAPARHDPRHPSLRHSPVRFARNDIRLDASTNEAAIRSRFGAPIERDANDEEIVLYHNHADLRLEFELSPAGTLTRLNVFPR